MPKLHPQHCNRPPAASSPSSVPHLRDHSDLPQPPSPLHCFVSASTVHRNILGMHLPHRPGKQIKQGRRQAIFRSSLSFLSSKYNTSVSSPTLYQATQCCHSYFYASISRGLSRFWWHTLLSYLLWTLWATPTPSSPSPLLSVRSQYIFYPEPSGCFWKITEEFLLSNSWTPPSLKNQRGQQKPMNTHQANIRLDIST